MKMMLVWLSLIRGRLSSIFKDTFHEP